MKKNLATLIVILFGIHTALLSQTKTEAQKSVEKRMTIQEKFWNEGQIDGFMSMYWKNDSLEFIGSKGITYGWQNTLDNYKKSYPDKEAMGELKFTILSNKQLSKNYIYIIGKWQLTKEKPVGGHFTLLWKKINNNWFIISDHTS